LPEAATRKPTVSAPQAYGKKSDKKRVLYKHVSSACLTGGGKQKIRDMENSGLKMMMGKMLKWVI